MELDLGDEIVHLDIPGSTIAGYDPAKRHERYLRTRHLKGRKPGVAQPTISSAPSRVSASMPATTHAHQKHQLQQRIHTLESKLAKLDQKIAKMEHLTPAELAAKRTQARKYRRTHKQELASKAKRNHATAKAGSSSTKSGGDTRLAELKKLRSKVAGQIEAAKQKLSTL